MKDDLVSDKEAKPAALAERTRVSPTISNADDDEEHDEKHDDEEEDYEVEAIVAHQWRRQRGKTQPPALLYNVKWKGYPDSENTFEPEENLLGARDLLAAYHHQIGGAPQPPTAEETKKIKKKNPAKPLLGDSLVSDTDDSATPPAKRQRRMTGDESGNEKEIDEFGSWQPDAASWEKQVQAIQTVERDEKTNDLYILMIFKNGKKSRVKSSLVRKSVLRDYSISTKHICQYRPSSHVWIDVLSHGDEEFHRG